MERRHVLSSLGVSSTAALTGLAGCAELGVQTDGSDGMPDGERAAYDDWVAADGDDSVFALTMQLAALDDPREDEYAATETTTTTDGHRDLLREIPETFRTFAGRVIGGYTDLVEMYLQYWIEDEKPIEGIHVLGGDWVLEGDIDVDEVSSNIEDRNETRRVGEHEGYTLYREDPGETAWLVGISSDAAVFGTWSEEFSETLAAAKELIDVDAGTVGRYREQSAAYDSLATALPAGDLVGVEFDSDGGLFGDETETSDGSDRLPWFTELDLDGDALGGAVRTSNEDDAFRSTVAIRYANAGEVDTEGDIEAAFGARADEYTVTIDGPMVYVDGSYR